MADRMPATAGTSQVPTALKYTHIHTTNRLTASGVTVAFANAAFTVCAASLLSTEHATNAPVMSVEYRYATHRFAKVAIYL